MALKGGRSCGVAFQDRFCQSEERDDLLRLGCFHSVSSTIDKYQIPDHDRVKSPGVNTNERKPNLISKRRADLFLFSPVEKDLQDLLLFLV